MAYKWIYKVGLAVVSDGSLLVVRKRGTGTFILPGGKPEGLEGDLATLAREVDEELGSRVEHPFCRGEFKDIATAAAHSVVVVRLYTANLVGNPSPRSEIEELAWVALRGPRHVAVAPSIANRIIPFLRKRARLAGRSVRQSGGEAPQGMLEIA